MAKYIVNVNKIKAQISKHIYGHFSEHLGRCIYEGIWVGEDSNIPNVKGIRSDVVEALKDIKVPVLRWPGGCFADEYHWKDGVGPKENRKKMINTHWGGVTEDNSFGTHEFMELCKQIGCEPYVNGNLGSGTVQEMSEWVEYMTLDGISPMADWRKENGREEPWSIKYFGVGNENWGCGGNMRPEYYADEYRRYSTYVRNFGENNIYKIACGPNSDDYNWTEVLMERAGNYMDALTLHYYTVPGESWNNKGSATDFNQEIYYRTMKKTTFMEELLEKHINIMDKYDPEKKVALIVDEWGTWYNVEPGTNPGFLYQQNTMRDAMVAGVNLNIFNKHADRIHMANIAQMVNVLQAAILTEGEKMVLTPTYHIFNMFAEHQDSTLLESFITTNEVGIGEEIVKDIYESASLGKDGSIHITICNLDLDNSKKINGELFGANVKSVTAKVLKGEMDSYNTFENPQALKIEILNDVSLVEGVFKAVLPPCSVVSLAFK